MPRAALTSRGASRTATADDASCAATNAEYFMMFSLEVCAMLEMWSMYTTGIRRVPSVAG
jgi:hypothetical protein